MKQNRRRKKYNKNRNGIVLVLRIKTRANTHKTAVERKRNIYVVQLKIKVSEAMNLINSNERNSIVWKTRKYQRPSRVPPTVELRRN